MSLVILLIPAAMAAYAAWQARAEAGAANCQVETRWRHAGLLGRALADLDAQDVSVSSESASATVDGTAVTFVRREDGIMTAHFPRDIDIDRAVHLVNEVDAAYTRRVQDAVYRRIRERVGELGYDIDSESVDDDETITLVVNVG